MIRWLADLEAMLAAGDCVLVTVASVTGSVPREPGAKLLVGVDEVRGTIGGGHLEFKATEIAKNMLGNGGASSLHRFALGAALGQCCGGAVTLFFERVVAAQSAWRQPLTRHIEDGCACVIATAAGSGTCAKLLLAGNLAHGSLGDHRLDQQAALYAANGITRLVELESASGRGVSVLIESLQDCDFRILLFGAGHVGRALVAVLAEVDCSVNWIDTRDDAFPDVIPANARRIATDTPESEVAAAPAGSHFLVMSHSHDLDYTLAEAILRRADFASFGLIGSSTKRRRFEQRFAQRGLVPEIMQRMTCPIGIASIEGKQPATIAISVAAQLLELRERCVAAASQSAAGGFGVAS
jgi:xanthine dehydrogenase accessory factor